ncbi:D-TA family PLP-dependent enzyme [Sphingobacterium corticibacterium]|uniref:D-TA family PLP-dependent enzyme n=1 Tax=Sphingobacterium corticibacterium TaxID=2484746 RepID=A0A4Q6XHG5_9SPHI|nr:D-TA family PLP-dependent enzyme [Sphingobacterium corticibacterium]RZF59361.1 D-TA family PLP-dependent enzyme [Sphingobacterium corticibacterium]
MNWYNLHTPEHVDTPTLLVYPDRIQHNIEVLKGMIDRVDRLRAHVKTHKTKEITRMQLDVGIRKFKCATIAEAEMLGVCGAPDVLLAYPLHGAKLQRFVALIQHFPQTRFSAIVDHVDAVENLSATAVKNNIQVDVFIDLNIGMGRTGIRPDDAAFELYRFCSEMDGLHVQGFHAYDGHVREVDMVERKKVCDRNYEPIAKLIERLLGEGFEKPSVVIGGSPSFPIYAQYPEVECSPGTFVLWDKGYADTLPEQHFLPGAVLMTRVVSLPSENTICVDLGYKAIASENPLDNRVFFLNAPHLKPISHSEEHLVLEAGVNHRFQVGDVLYALPIHICPTVALYDKLLAVEEGKVVDEWEVVARRR